MTIPNTKAARHRRIVEVLDRVPVGSQAALAELLAADGFVVTQATLSRDLDELGAVKVAAPGGELVLTAEQQCADGTVLKSEPTLEASDEVIDPRMTVRIAPEVAPGATAAQVALAVGAFVLLVAALAEVAGRRSRRR